MNCKERVQAAVHFQKPDCAPVLLYNRDFEQSDIIVIEVEQQWGGPNKDASEWGYVWEHMDDTMGQPREPIVPDLEKLDAYKAPDAYRADRFSHVAGVMEKYPGKYYVASLALTGFTVMTLLHGFSATLEDLYLDRENAERLADLVFEFENDIIRQAKAHGFDAVGFFDDWGTQNNLIISPALWREFFGPRYKKQFDLVHENGMDVYFHSCGKIDGIIPDLIDLGVDILNLSQPNVYDMAEIGRNFRGKTCFLEPISYQTTSLSGTREDIFEAAESMITNLGTENGGFIGYVEEYHSIGLSEENYQNCIEAFRVKGQYHHEDN